MALEAVHENSATIGVSYWSLPDSESGTPTPETTDGEYQFWLDLSALQFGDEYEFRVLEKVQSSGVERVALLAYFSGTQATPVHFTGKLQLMHGWDATLRKLAGTNRSIGWSIRRETFLDPTVSGRTLDVSANGNAGIDWANIDAPTTAVNLSGTNIDTDQVVASVSGAVGSVTGAVGSIAAGGIAATSFADNAITAAKIADGAIDAATFANNAITAASIADGAIDAATFASDVDAEILSYIVDDATRVDASALNTASGRVDVAVSTRLAAASYTAPDNAGISAIGVIVTNIQTQVGTAGNGLTAIPWNAAWDAEVQSEVQDALEANHLDHLFAATYDPASKPGAADAFLNELVESDGGVTRFTANALEQAPTGGSAPSAADIRAEIDNNSTQLAAIKAKTDSLTFTVAGVLDANIQRINDVTITGDGSGTPFNV